LSTQNSDGVFGFYQGDDSNVYMTALVSITLQQFQRTTSIATAINKATSYLIAHQNADGGFGSGGARPSPYIVYETSLRSGRIAQDYFEWRLLSFDSERGKKYKFKMTFKSNDMRFDQVKKEIYIEEDYDYAALPWWALFRLIFLSIFIVTFIPLLIIGILSVRKRRSRSN